jgi:hypothetical protein
MALPHALAEDVYFKLSGNLTPSSKIGYKKQIIVIVLIVNCVKRMLISKQWEEQH